MRSGSWASYRAAMPPECFGEPDGDEPRAAPSHCDGCGRFVPKGTPVQSEPTSNAGPARDWWICPACVGKVRTARTPEQCRADDEADRVACDEAMRETWEEESRRMAAEADRDAADFRAYEAALTAGPMPEPGDDEIPW